MVGLLAGRRAHQILLRAAALTFSVVAGCASHGATPAPDTSLPPLPPIVGATTSSTAVATTAAQPATSQALLDVYGLPLDTGVTYTVPVPPATTAPLPPPPASAPPVKQTAPPTTDCPRKKHPRRCRP